MEEGFDYYAKLKPLKNGNVVRKIILARDSYTCQFCLVPLRYSQCTLDHLIPRVHFKRNGWPKGDSSTYLNLVNSCSPCNAAKGGRSCEESGMWPALLPTIPTEIRLNHFGKMHKVQTIFVQQFYTKCTLSGEITVLFENPTN